jgi:hypothetical protein
MDHHRPPQTDMCILVKIARFVSTTVSFAEIETW